MTEQPKEEQKPNEEQKPKEECCKKEFPGFHGFHGFGPRCHGFPPMFGIPPCHPHKHKERKCECGEVIPKRKEGEPKIKVCPKCGKDLPKKQHGFGMRCHKMKKMMKFMNTFGMWPHFGHEFGHEFRPEFWQEHPPCPPGPPHRGLEVHHYIHFDNPDHHGPHRRPPMGPPGFGRPPMGPPGFGRPW